MKKKERQKANKKWELSCCLMGVWIYIYIYVYIVVIVVDVDSVET